MIQAIRLRQNGGPEQMELVDVEVGQPGPGEIRIRHHAVGLNFIDVYQRTGLYPFPMPLTLGMPAPGLVDALGARVTQPPAGSPAARPAHNPPRPTPDARQPPHAAHLLT